jgi:glycosyltransferase involved in cell wall biosynthesis
VSAPFVSIVLPCLNEAGSVGLVVRQSLSALAEAGLDGEVVVADNGSDDGSQELARAAGARVIDAPIRGYGAALAAGFLAARGDICVMGDADATYPFERLAELVAPVARGEADMVLGSRWVDENAKHMPFLHRFVGTPVITWLVRRAGGPRDLTDSQSGFRAFRRQALLDLDLQTAGMEYASEMLIVAGRAGWRVRELPTGYRERIGESKLDTFRDGWRHLRTVLLLAPHLAATLPGVGLTAAGAAALLWALVDANISRVGAPGWAASFLGLVAVSIGIQGILVGLLLAAASPFSHGRSVDPGRLTASYAVGGAWALGSGTVLCLVLVASWIVALPMPFRGAQIALIALVLVLTGANAIGDAIIGRLLIDGSRRLRRPAASVPVPPSRAVEAEAETAAVR